MTEPFPGISGKTAIVTGASSGIGLATARILAANGVNVALVSRSANKLREIAAALPGTRAFPADMTRVTEIRKMVDKVRKHYGRIDILVNNAGQAYMAPVEKTEIVTFRHMYDLNVIGPLVAMQEVIPVMRAHGGGRIINISSGTALMHQPGLSPYSSSKRALAGISLAARQDLEADRIVVSVVYPYITRTNFIKNSIRALPVTDDNREPRGPYPADTPEFVAETIVRGIVSGEAEIFAHEWMKEFRA